MTTDPVAAQIGYLRACVEAAQVTPEAFDLDVLMPNLGRALTALDEVLKLHVPETVDGIRPFRCCSYCSGRPAWPCPTVQAISRALLGEESDRA